jgi:hypothetical protein
MNKKLGLVAVLCAVLTSGAFAKTALGLQGGATVGSGVGGNVAVTFKVSSVPCVFAVDLGMAGGQLGYVGVTADWWAFNKRLAGMLNWYFAPGIAVGANFYGNAFNYVEFGPRFVLGLNAFVIEPLELYAQVAWQPMIWVSDQLYWGWNNFPINFGFRFWF